MMESTDRTLFGVPVQESEHIGRDIVFHLQPQHVVIMHPLMRIELTHRGDPIGHSEAVARYFTERTERQLDAVLARVNAMARYFAVRAEDEAEAVSGWATLGALQRDGGVAATWTMSGLAADDEIIQVYWPGLRTVDEARAMMLGATR